MKLKSMKLIINISP